MGWALSFTGILCGYWLYLYCADDFNPEELTGINVLVTGASRGIGRGLALQYAKYGANVFLTARNQESLTQVYEECKKVGRPDAKFGYTAADMSDYARSVPEVIKAIVETFGGIDHLVLNHAILHSFKKFRGDLSDLENAHSAIKVNYLSYVQLTANALPYMRNNQIHSPSRISVIGSICGKLSMRSGPEYCASKFALDGYFSSVRELFEFEQTKITITYSVIGPIATERIQQNVAEGLEKREIDFSFFNPIKLFILMGYGSVEEVCRKVIKATAKGQPEVYYPHLFGFIPNGYKFLIFIRHLCPSCFYCS